MEISTAVARLRNSLPQLGKQLHKLPKRTVCSQPVTSSNFQDPPGLVCHSACHWDATAQAEVAALLVNALTLKGIQTTDYASGFRPLETVTRCGLSASNQFSHQVQQLSCWRGLLFDAMCAGLLDPMQLIAEPSEHQITGKLTL